MATANVYLNFNGNCEEAFNFYKSVFGGEFHYISRFKDMPEQNGQPAMPKEMENQIMHVSLPIGETIIMGSDCGAEWAPSFNAGNNFSISLNAESKEEVDTLFKGLSENGTITMPLADTFWGDYFGMCIDQFGVNWMISYKIAD